MNGTESPKPRCCTKRLELGLRDADRQARKQGDGEGAELGDQRRADRGEG